MKNRNLKISVTVASTILLAVLSIYFSEDFTRFVLSQFKDLDVTFVSTELLGQSNLNFTFVFVITMLPSLFLFSNFALKDQKSWIFLVIIPVTLICGVALMAFHIYSLRAEVAEFSESMPFMKNSMSISKIHAARYLGIGFLMGIIISTAILSFLTRDKKS